MSLSFGRYITPREYETMFGGQQTPFVPAGSEGLPEFTESQYVALWCVGRDRPRQVTNPPLAKKPLWPRFMFEGKYTCQECKQIVNSMRGYCSRHADYPVKDDFLKECRASVLPVARNKSQVVDKCEDFHIYMSDLYCPMDPCDQLTVSVSNAPNALCDLARCYDPEKPSPEPYTVPLTCPKYIEYIMGQCKKMKEKNGPHSHSKLTKAMACKAFSPRFLRDGCNVVFDKMKKIASPLSVCTLGVCDGMVGSLDDYCQDELKLPSDEPVPTAGYPPEESPPAEDCDKSLGGIVVLNATYGVNCTHENHTNNILESVKSHCEGRTRCTWGNEDMVNKSSWWDPLTGDDTCEHAFELKYRCMPSGPMHIVNAPDTAKFAKLPIDCTDEIAKAYPSPGPKVQSVQQGYHVP